MINFLFKIFKIMLNYDIIFNYIFFKYLYIFYVFYDYHKKKKDYKLKIGKILNNKIILL